jgi:cellulose synthase/poly-beta-1,6-N-acetylglucosamine synthase-like glycosyltransferase
MVITAGIGVCAYNEEKNIGQLLERLTRQRVLQPFDLREIVVVASGCTDSTEDIVREWTRRDKRIRLISEPTRTGKSHAVNLLLKSIKSDIFIMENADTLPENDLTINRLLQPFLDAGVGMAGGRPVPTNGFDTVAGFVNNLIWELHHQVSLNDPKMSELLAIRIQLVREIPTDSAVDDAAIEALASRSNKKYVPDAIVLNRGPESLGGIFKQRKRICIGHAHLRQTQHYTVSTMKVSKTFGPLLQTIRVIKAKTRFGVTGYFKVLLAILLESYARLSANFDFSVKGANPYKWEILETTKAVR